MKALLVMLVMMSPVFADELQVDVTGLSDNGQTSGNFDINFVVDTLSGQQSYTTADGHLTGLSGSGIVITNLTASVDGVNVASIPSATGLLGGDLINGSGLIFGGLSMGGFEWQIDIQPVAIDPSDPLRGLITSGFAPDYEHSFITFAGYIGTEATVRTSARSVPEPGTLGLLALALGGLIIKLKFDNTRRR